MSDAATTKWQARNAWTGFANDGRFGRMAGEAGVTLTVLDGYGLATIIVRRGEEPALAAAMHDLFGLDLPTAGKALFGTTGDLVWSAPGQWLVVGPRQSLAGLPGRLAGIAAVTDQSDGRALLRIGGPDARSMLAKGFAIDLHPSAFAAGSTAVTSVAHTSLQLWQSDDAPTFVLAAPRGFAGSVWSWLSEAAAEYGYAVTQDVAALG